MCQHRRLVAGCLAVGFLLTLAFSVSAEKVKIVFAGRAPFDQAQSVAWQKAMEEYSKANPDVEFEYFGEANHSMYMEKLYIMAAAGTFPDVLHLYNPWTPDFAAQKLIDPMPTSIVNVVKRDLHPQSLIGAEYQGVQYGVPTEFQVSGLIYNKTLTAEAGIGAVPRTWEEMATVAKRLSAAQPSDKKTGVMAFNGGGWGWTGNWFALTTAYGATYANEAGEIALDSNASRKVMSMLVEWFGQDKWANLNRDGFCRGQIPFGFAYPFWGTTLSAYNGAGFVNQFGVTRMPAGANGIGGYQYGWGLYVSSLSKHKDEAWRFVEWLATMPKFQGLSAIGSFQGMIGSLPTNRREINVGLFGEKSVFLNGFIDNLPYAVTEAKLPAADARQNALGAAIDAAVALKTTPQQALADATQAINTLLANARKK